MPLTRYFYSVGGVLLALLFILDACFPRLPDAKATSDPPAIRIHSDRKWPERIVYDTSLPTIVPVSVATAEPAVRAPEKVVEVPSAAKEREAFAMLSSSADRSQASPAKMREPKPQRHRKVARKRAPAPMIAMARQMQFGWFGRNFW
jgi:hypothetical protein